MRKAILMLLCSLCWAQTNTAVITAISPASYPAGANQALIVTGKNFGTQPSVKIDGVAVPTTLVSSTQLSAAVPAAVKIGAHPITVYRPGPRTTSAPAMLMVTDPCGAPGYKCSSAYGGIVDEPAVPKVGGLAGAGTLVQDASFLGVGATQPTPICRVTDGNSSSNHATFQVTQGGGGPVFNADSSMLIVNKVGNADYIVKGNWDTCAIAWTVKPKFPGNYSFSRSDPHKLWILTNTLLSTATIDDAGNISTPVPQFDFANNPGPVPHSSKCLAAGYRVKYSPFSVNADQDQVLGATFSTGPQGTGFEIAVLKIGAGCSYLNTLTGETRSDWGFNGTVVLPQAAAIHDGGQTQSPRYFGWSGTGLPWNFLWDITAGANSVWQCGNQTHGCSGHGVAGHTAWFKGAPRLQKRPYASPFTLTMLTPQLPAGVEMHASYNNSDLSDTLPFFIFTSAGRVCESPANVHPYPGPYWDEIDAVTPDGSLTTKRIAHNFNSGESLTFGIACADTSVSSDGKYLAFGSDWEKQLGCADGTASPCSAPSLVRGDVFIAIPK